MKKFEWLIYIGRFQPYHNGHDLVLRDALQHAENVLVLVGSADQPRTLKNPFTWSERAAIIRAANPFEAITFAPIFDYPYNDLKWADSIKRRVDAIVGSNCRIGLAGLEKDESSYYLKMFPAWPRHSAPVSPVFNATDIRKMLFYHVGLYGTNDIKPLMPTASFEQMQTILNVRAAELCHLKDESRYYEAWNLSWANSPYPPTFNTVDNLVFRGQDILLIKRKNLPGEGLWALPGGFLNPNETLEQAALRELQEETGIVPSGRIHCEDGGAPRTFYYPGRSQRGTVVTQVFKWTVDNGTEALAGDDAAECQWIDPRSISRNMMFEDHYHLIHESLGGYR